MRAHVDTGQEAAKQEDGEGTKVEPIGTNDPAKGAAGSPDKESRLAPVTLHDRGDRRCCQHGTGDDQRNRQGRETGIAGKRLTCETTNGEDHRHLRAQKGLRKHENDNIAFGDAVVGEGEAVSHDRCVSLNIRQGKIDAASVRYAREKDARRGDT